MYLQKIKYPQENLDPKVLIKRVSGIFSLGLFNKHIVYLN
jgi:hypothetical protein